MKKYKYWSINCTLLNDQGFEEFVEDIERYIVTLKGNWTLPQKNSENWLKKFVDGYETWSDRKFMPNRFPLLSYFKIDQRMLKSSKHI